MGLQPEDNPYMIGYYDRLKPAIKDMVANENLMTRQAIEAYAKKNTDWIRLSFHWTPVSFVM